MAITDRTRKLLWGRSGNRCALCRRLLVMPETQSDRESVVGDECHILSPAPDGPRATASELKDPDSYSNLILLCKVDHKRVDDQPNTFDGDRLQALKYAHETWVEASLNVAPPAEQTVEAGRSHTATRVTRVDTGGELLEIVGGCHGYDFDHDELEDEAEVELLSSFLQDLHDIGDLFNDMESGERVRTRYRLTESLSELRDLGFVVYGGQSKRFAAVRDKKIPMEIAMIRVFKVTNARIWDPTVLDEFAKHFAAESDPEAKETDVGG